MRRHILKIQFISLLLTKNRLVNVLTENLEYLLTRTTYLDIVHPFTETVFCLS